MSEELVSPPALSVVVAATDGPEAVRRVIGDLRLQRNAPEIEVIVVDGTGNVGLAALGAFPGPTRLVAAKGADVTALRAAGLHEARGQLVAFTEDHCRLAADWCVSLLRVWHEGHRAFGGPIENGHFRAPMDWAAYFVEFSRFMPPCVPGRTDTLPGMNAAYDRTLLASVMDGPLCEPLVHAAIQKRGIDLLFGSIPSVIFERHFGAGAFVYHCYSSGRTFAGLRLVDSPRLHRIAYGFAAAIFLPFVMSARIGSAVLKKRRDRLAFALAAPWIVLYTGAWGLGEAAGAFLPQTPLLPSTVRAVE